MEQFGGLPPEARGMDLFHLMSEWRSGEEKRITGWRYINWHEGGGGEDTMQYFTHQTELSVDYFGGLFHLNYFGCDM